MKKVVMIIVDEEFDERSLWPADYDGAMHSFGFLASKYDIRNADFLEKRLAPFPKLIARTDFSSL